MEATARLTNILCLDDDCLEEIVSNIDNFKAFCSCALSCKRLYQASLHSKSWHINIIRRKIRYYGTKFVINEFPKYKNHWSNLPMIEDLVKIADTYHKTKPTQDNVRAILDARGHVASELFKWIADIKFRQIFSNNGELTDTIKKMVIHLPFSGHMTIFTVFNLKKNTIALRLVYNSARFDYEYEINETSNVFPRINEHHAKSIIIGARDFVNILTKELGETDSPSLGELFVWLCFYPDSLEESFLGDFAGSFPRSEFKANAIHAAQMPSVPYQGERLMKIVGESLNIRTIRQLVKQLNKRQRANMLHDLSKEIYFILQDVDNLTRICPLSPELILNLAVRISFLPGVSLGGFESQPEKTHFNIRTKDGRILQVEKVGLPLAKFQSIWNFTLPSGKYLHFEISEFERWRPVDEGDAFVLLQPITELLEECINDDMPNNKHVRLTNRFTDKLLSACLSYNHCDKVYYGF